MFVAPIPGNPVMGGIRQRADGTAPTLLLAGVSVRREEPQEPAQSGSGRRKGRSIGYPFVSGADWVNRWQIASRCEADSNRSIYVSSASPRERHRVRGHQFRLSAPTG